MRKDFVGNVTTSSAEEKMPLIVNTLISRIMLVIYACLAIIEKSTWPLNRETNKKIIEIC